MCQRRTACPRVFAPCRSALFALVVCVAMLAAGFAHAQTTGGSFGGARWGAGAPSRRAEPAAPRDEPRAPDRDTSWPHRQSRDEPPFAVAPPMQDAPTTPQPSGPPQPWHKTATEMLWVLFCAFPLAVGVLSVESPGRLRALLVASNAPLPIAFVSLAIYMPGSATDRVLLGLYVVHGVFVFAAATHVVSRVVGRRRDRE